MIKLIRRQSDAGICARWGRFAWVSDTAEVTELSVCLLTYLFIYLSVWLLIYLFACLSESVFLSSWFDRLTYLWNLCKR